MKTNMLLATSTALLLFATVTGYCQPGPPKPRDERQILPPAPGPRPGQEATQVSSFNGQVADWVNNDEYVYDGFYLQTSSAKLLVKFPAQMGTQLKTVAKTGNTIIVNGVPETTPTGEKIVKIVSVTANGQTIYDTPPAAPTTPPANDFVTGSGKINTLQKTREGDVNGFILDNKTILRVPPHVAMQLGQAAVAGATISYTGVKKSSTGGEVSAGNFTIVHCQTITLNGTQYLTR